MKNNNILKKAILIAINIVFFLSAQGKSDSTKFDFNNRFIRAWTITPGSFINLSPKGVCPTSITPEGYVTGNFTTLGILYHHHFRYNLAEFNGENAIGLNFSPNIGVSMLALNFDVDGFHFGHLALPLYVSYEYGAGSTYTSEKEVGGSIGFGLEYSLIPFASFGAEIDYEMAKYLKKSYFSPVFTFSKRSWSKYTPYLSTKNFKIAAFPYTLRNYATNTDEKFYAFSFTFSFGNLIHY